MALKDTEIDSAVKETIGKTGKSCVLMDLFLRSALQREGQNKQDFAVICRSRVVQLHENTVSFFNYWVGLQGLSTAFWTNDTFLVCLMVRLCHILDGMSRSGLEHEFLFSALTLVSFLSSTQQRPRV